MACKICKGSKISSIHGNGFIGRNNPNGEAPSVRFLVHTGIGVQIIRCLDCSFSSVEFVHPQIVQIIYETPPLAFVPTDTSKIEQLHKNNCINQLRFFEQNYPKRQTCALFIGAGRAQNASMFSTLFNEIYACDLVPSHNQLSGNDPILSVIRFHELQDSNHFERFDALFLSNVLERVAFPSNLIRLCAKLIKPGGILLIEVPEMSDELIFENEYGREEINFFSQRSIEKLITLDGNFQINLIQKFEEPIALKDATYFGMQSKNKMSSKKRTVLRLALKNHRQNLSNEKSDLDQNEIPELLYNLSYASLIASFGLSRFSEAHISSSIEIQKQKTLTSVKNDH